MNRLESCSSALPSELTGQIGALEPSSPMDPPGQLVAMGQAI